MQKFPNKLVALSLSSVLLAAGGIALTNGSSLSASAEEGIMPLACTTVNAPTVDWKNSASHNCFATYAIQQNDAHASTIYFRTSANAQSDTFSMKVAEGETSNYVVAPLYSGETQCYPTCQVMRTKCDVEGIYSDYGQDLRDGTKYLYSRFSYTQKTLGGTAIPTGWDLSWSYTAQANDYIYFSIAYNNEVADGSLNIRSVFSNSTSQEVGGITFTVKVNKTELYLKANKSVSFDGYTSMFAFYLQQS